ncbi:MAG: hypothetical protein WBL06_13575 [Pseudolysinimonas sp.]|jgi:hypothetical protein|uniref:hypothetical protein n=1 Tax=Pseudolysinimonas sp. TaxID=2680009 RepID=UPI003C75E5D3
MSRAIVALIAEVLLVVVVALLLGTVWQWFLTADLTSAIAEGARLLFLFMDVGLALWLVALIVLVVRRRSLPGIGATLLAALVGVVINAIVVLIVGLVQGGWNAFLVPFAIEAGIAFLVAVFVVAPIIRRLFRADVKPSVESTPPA